MVSAGQWRNDYCSSGDTKGKQIPRSVMATSIKAQYVHAKMTAVYA
jgi:hypothetical protein